MISNFRTYILYIIPILFLAGCQKPVSELSSSFSCNSPVELSGFEKVDDFKNNFRIQVPKHWNTKLYYDKIQSEIFTADTIKHLSDSYIINYSAVSGNIDINDELKGKVHQKSMDNAMETLKESFHSYKGNDAFAHLSVGSSRGLKLHVFQYYIKLSEEQYILVKTELYGEENFDSRFCESLSIIEKMTFIK